ncbi:MAG: cysteine desulfurase [Myxococcota bacterium]|nr:cysteine desulfurase [Myxococcota bacterium]
MIYLDHNATTPLAPTALEAMLPYLRERYGNPSSPYRFGNEARGAVERARSRIAECIGCKPVEIIFCASGTEADNLALRGVAHALEARGRHIVTTAIEHPAVLHTCKALEREGFRLTYLPVSDDGAVEPGALAASLCPDTIMVSAMHANNETGVLQPIEEIAAIARRRGVLLHTDAVQSVGKVPFRVDDLGADLIAFSGHKLYGPKGIGVLYARRGTQLTSVITGGGHELGLRAGTENVAAIIGLAEAVCLAFEEQEAQAVRLGALRDRFERRVCAAIRRIKINGEGTPRVPSTSSLSVQGVDGESIVLGLDVRGICVSTGSACSTGEDEPSHVLRAMGRPAQEARGAIRLSLGKETREADMDTTVQVLTETVERLRSISSDRG